MENSLKGKKMRFKPEPADIDLWKAYEALDAKVDWYRHNRDVLYKEILQAGCRKKLTEMEWHDLSHRLGIYGAIMNIDMHKIRGIAQ